MNLRDVLICFFLFVVAVGLAVFKVSRSKDKTVSTVESLVDALANAREGEVVYLAPGTYILSNTLVIPEGVTLRGDSNDPPWLLFPNTTIGISISASTNTL
jgi:hypothetical protein